MPTTVSIALCRQLWPVISWRLWRNHIQFCAAVLRLCIIRGLLRPISSQIPVFLRPHLRAAGHRSDKGTLEERFVPGLPVIYVRG